MLRIQIKFFPVSKKHSSVKRCDQELAKT